MSEGKVGRLKKVKRIRLLNWFLICLANNKIVLTVPKDSKHYTLNILPEGLLDFHETIEGKEKKYRSLERFDLKKFVEEMKEVIKSGLPNIMKEIDITDSSYEDTNVILIPPERSVEESVEVRHREITIGWNTLQGTMHPVPMKDLQSYDFKTAFLEHEKQVYVLYRIAGRYFLLKIDDLAALLEKVIRQSNIQGFG